MDCPKCHAANPDTSRFCGSCAAPLQEGAPPDAPALTKTLKATPPVQAEGSVVAGKYKVLRQIGRGGMGVVYEAEDVKLRRAVALKFLPGELTDDDEARERFTHEAQAASVLDNPHICTIHEIGETESRQMYIAMALCHGESLRTKVKRGPLDPGEALSIAAQVADGLAAAHESGIIHRDIKPGNILITKEGTARIADFGLAKLAGEARLTRPGSTVGTVAYMSPEHLRGEDVDGRTDVWSLGVVLYEMLTGRLPFQGQNEHSLAYAIVHSSPDFVQSLLPGLPAGCGPVIEKALAKDPAKRFASAREMAEALAAVRESAGLLSSRRTKKREARPRRPALIRIGLPAVLIAAAAFVLVALGLPQKVAALLGIGPRAGEGKHITIFDPAVLAESTEDQVLGAGLAEYLRRSLDGIARRTRSWVTPVEHLDAYGVREASDASRVLGSNVVVSGTLKRAGENLTLTLDAVDPARLTRLVSLPKSDNIANIATWQEDLVLEAAVALGLVTAPADRTALAAAGTTVPAALHAYLRGLGFMRSVYDSSGPGSSEIVDTVAAAIAALEEAVRFDPSFASAGIDLADAYRWKSAPGKDPSSALHAEGIVRDILRNKDGQARGHFVLGRILRSLGRNDEAARELERASELDPLDYDTLTRLGMLYEDTNQPAKAEAAYRKAIRVRPGYWTGPIYLGLFFFYQGSYEKAREEFEKVARLCPGNINVLNDLGGAYFKLGDYGRSMAAFERSNALKKNPEACSNLGGLYYYSGRYADSVMANEAAISFGPTDYAYLIWGNLADAYHFTPGNEAKAAEAYRKAIDLTEQALAEAPGDARTRSSLAVFLAKAGEADRAVTEIEKALEAMPDDSSLVLKAVIVYDLSGARPRALQAMRDFVRLKGPMEEIVRDPFLAGLRQDREYLEIIGQAAGGTSGRAGKNPN